MSGGGGTEHAGAVTFHRREAAAHLAIAVALEDGTYDALMAYSGAFVPVGWVAERLGLTAQAANNRLRKLFDRGVARRRYAGIPGGGRIYEYHWLAKVGAR